jgi:hypothetical protein
VVAEGPLAPREAGARPSARRRRLVRLAIIAGGLLAFAAVSAWLARFLSTENAERNGVYELLRRQAAGDAQGMLNRLDGCRTDPSCVATVEHDAQAERRPGAVQILALSSPTAYSLTAARGETRIAWRAGSGLPVVQCVRIDRRGNALTGLSIVMRRISAPIGNEADCR